MSNLPFQTLKTLLTSAQILTLNSNPVLLIPGRSGSVIDITSVYYRYLHGTTQFNPNADDAVCLVFGPVAVGNLVVNQVVATGFVDQIVDQSCWGLAGWAGAENFNAGIPNFPLSASYLGAGVSITQFNIGDTFPTGSNWSQGNGQLAVFITYAYLEV